MNFQKGDYVVHKDGLYSIGKVYDLYHETYALVDFNSTEGRFVEMVPFDKLELRHRKDEHDVIRAMDGSPKGLNLRGKLYHFMCVHRMNLMDPPCCSCDYGYLYSEEDLETQLCQECRDWDKEDE